MTRFHKKKIIKIDDKTIEIPFCQCVTGKSYQYADDGDDGEISCARCWALLNKKRIGQK